MITVTHKIQFTRGTAGRCRVSTAKPKPKPEATPRIPRIAKLVALAIRFDRLVRNGTVSDQSDLARLSHVSQPRMSQIMNLNYLAPDIQEELLFLPCVTAGKDPINEKILRPLASEIDWQKQREMWTRLKSQ
jgi:hypothetical protein